MGSALHRHGSIPSRPRPSRPLGHRPDRHRSNPDPIAWYRLLLAVLHRALTTHHGPWKDADRIRWYREGLPEAPIRAYLEQWRERLWLFHPEYPFMQVAGLADAPETQGKLKPWTRIYLEGASGNAPVMFDHALDDSPSMIPRALACRNLLGALQFTPGGLVKTIRDSDKAGPLANTAAALPTGPTLGRTLLVGLHPPSRAGLEDLPAWERPPPGIAELRAAPRLASGPNDRYTRQSRAVLLVPEDIDPRIRHIRYAAGLALERMRMPPTPWPATAWPRTGRPSAYPSP
jgi:CRISPR system Cascade subunit CasA